MGSYWMLTVYAPSDERRAVVGRQPDLSRIVPEPFFSWYSGERFRHALPVPFQIQLDPEGGDYVTDFFPPSIPLMSVHMLQALAHAGVDNIDTYDVVLLGRHGEQLRESFAAINIIGRVACADLEASDCTPDNPGNPLAFDFESLVIDEKRTADASFFRLHEAPNGIVVHDSIKRRIEPLALRGIHFVAPEDWSG
jgi:hypothetical protein